MNHFDFELGAHPLPSSPVKGEVPLSVRGNISPHTAAGTLRDTFAGIGPAGLSVIDGTNSKGAFRSTSTR